MGQYLDFCDCRISVLVRAIFGVRWGGDPATIATVRAPVIAICY